MKKKLYVIHFPYIGMRNIKEMKLINGYSLKRQDTIDLEDMLKVKVDSFLGSYKDYGRPILDGGILYADYEEPNIEEILEVRLVTALSILSNTLFSTMQREVTLHTTENFFLKSFTITINDNEKKFARSIPGFIYKQLDGVYDIEQLNFEKPEHTPTPFCFVCNESLIESIEVLKKSAPEIFNRVINSFALLLESYQNNPEVSYDTRILLLYAAFEKLLQVESETKKKELQEKVAKYTDVRGKDANEFNDQNQYTILDTWVHDFSELRNEIAHTKPSKGISHFNEGLIYSTGSRIFLHCIDGILREETKYTLGREVTYNKEYRDFNFGPMYPTQFS